VLLCIVMICLKWTYSSGADITEWGATGYGRTRTGILEGRDELQVTVCVRLQGIIFSIIGVTAMAGEPLSVSFVMAVFLTLSLKNHVKAIKRKKNATNK